MGWSEEKFASGGAAVSGRPSWRLLRPAPPGVHEILRLLRSLKNDKFGDF